MVAQLTTALLAGGNVAPHRSMPTQDSLLPAASVTYMGDQAKSDGDARTGIPDFVHRTIFVVDVVDRADDGPSLRTKLAAHSTIICTTLLTNLAWGGDTLEGLETVVHSVDLPPEGSVYLGRLQVQITALTRSVWEPVTTDLPDFATVQATIDTGDNQTGITIPVPTT